MITWFHSIRGIHSKLRATYDQAGSICTRPPLESGGAAPSRHKRFSGRAAWYYVRGAGFMGLFCGAWRGAWKGGATGVIYGASPVLARHLWDWGTEQRWLHDYCFLLLLVGKVSPLLSKCLLHSRYFVLYQILVEESWLRLLPFWFCEVCGI